MLIRLDWAIPGRIVFLLAVLSLAVLHTVGEVLYKRGGMSAFEDESSAKNLQSWSRFILSSIVILSLAITLVTKVLYGILLTSNPLNTTGGIYLAGVALISVLAGRTFFGERLAKGQILGFVLIAIGIIFLV